MVKAVLKHLGWQNFEAVGISGGAPFAYVFTERFAKLVNRLCLISLLGPIGMSGFSRVMPLRARLGLRVAAALPDALLKQIGKAILQGERPIESNFFSRSRDLIKRRPPIQLRNVRYKKRCAKQLPAAGLASVATPMPCLTHGHRCWVATADLSKFGTAPKISSFHLLWPVNFASSFPRPKFILCPTKATLV